MSPRLSPVLGAFIERVCQTPAPQWWVGYPWRVMSPSFDDCPPTERPPAPARCECGATVTYGAGATHSDWCPMAVRHG